MSGTTGQVGYNPYDPYQAALLAGIAGSENPTSNPFLGVGGTDLTGAATDAYGFPQWSGYGNSHAAGMFQFQPSTWDSVAAEHNLNFQNPQDQAAGAWYLAQQTYASKNGGASLYDAIQNGDYGQIQSSLGGQWTGVYGNAAQPTGLAGAMPGLLQAADYASANQSGGTYLNSTSLQQANWLTDPTGVVPPQNIPGHPSPLDTPGGAPNQGTGIVGGLLSGTLGAISNWVQRSFLIIVGAVIIVGALWFLLQGSEAKGVGRILSAST